MWIDAVNVGSLAGAAKSQVTSFFITNRSQVAPRRRQTGPAYSLQLKAACTAFRGFGSVRDQPTPYTDAEGTGATRCLASSNTNRRGPNTAGDAAASNTTRPIPLVPSSPVPYGSRCCGRFPLEAQQRRPL